MIVLGIETATLLCGVALVDEGPIAEYRLVRAAAHAEHLAEATKRLLQEAGLTMEVVRGVAVSIGPGSFTGLRAGLAFAKGIALGLGIPLADVPTMEGLLVTVPPIAPRACVVLIARKGEFYRGLYRHEGGCWRLECEVELIPEREGCKGLPDDPMLFLGPGVVDHEALFASHPGAILLDPWYSFPSGYGVAVIGREKILKGHVSEIDGLVPCYLKRFQGVV